MTRRRFLLRKQGIKRLFEELSLKEGSVKDKDRLISLYTGLEFIPNQSKDEFYKKYTYSFCVVIDSYFNVHKKSHLRQEQYKWDECRRRVT